MVTFEGRSAERLVPASTLNIMSQSPMHHDRPDADALNAAIRELWARSGGTLSADGQRTYQALIKAWAATQQGDIAPAA